MVLTKRDLELIAGLASYAIFTTRQIAEKYFCGVRLTTVLRRIRKLERAGFVDRVTGVIGAEAAWCLGTRGAEAIACPIFKRHFRRDVLEHDMKLTRLRLLLEGCGIAHSWIPEHEIRSLVARKHGLRALRERIVPDGIMGIEAKGCKESVAVELELSFKNRDRYLRTFRQYMEKANLYGVWYFVANAGIGRQVERVWREANVYGADIQFFWSLLGEIEAMTLAALVHGSGQGNEVRALFASKGNEGALPPAQGVSTQRATNETENPELTTEEKKKISLPA